MSKAQKGEYRCYICSYDAGPLARVCFRCMKTICPQHQEAIAMKWERFFYSAPYTLTICPNCWEGVKEELTKIGFTIFGSEQSKEAKD